MKRFCTCGNPSGQYGITSPIDTVDTCIDCGKILSQRPPVEKQGKCVCEYNADDEGWYVMTPDGDIQFSREKKDAEERCKLWFQTHTDPFQIGIGEIEWRS